MRRYLVYDSTCCTCTQLANSIQDIANGQLEIVSIHSEASITLLNKAFPEGWKHVPYLIFVERDQVRVWTGIQAALRLGSTLGPRRAWQIWSLARRRGVLTPFKSDPIAVSPARRKLLKSSLRIGVVAFLFKLLGIPILDTDEVQASTCGGCGCVSGCSGVFVDCVQYCGCVTSSPCHSSCWCVEKPDFITDVTCNYGGCQGHNYVICRSISCGDTFCGYCA